MKDIIIIIERVKNGDKDYFLDLLDKFNPLINKYVKLLYEEDEEDSYSEMCLALWIAVIKIEYINSEGQVVNYLNNAIRRKFYELYRVSSTRNYFEKKSDMNEVDVKDNTNDYDMIDVYESWSQYMNTNSVKKKKIYKLILVEGLSDKEIAKALNVSRQYINRVRNELKKQLIQYGDIAFCA